MADSILFLRAEMIDICTTYTIQNTKWTQTRYFPVSEILNEHVLLQCVTVLHQLMLRIICLYICRIY